MVGWGGPLTPPLGLGRAADGSARAGVGQSTDPVHTVRSHGAQISNVLQGGGAGGEDQFLPSVWPPPEY